jgi:DNA glycosylase AlkZ-like
MPASLRISLQMVSITWSQALAWRMRQQLLDPVGTESVEDVVHRLGAIRAQLDPAAELAVRTRRKQSESGEVARALADGRIIKSFTFRGATHLMTPEDGGVYLALRASSRMWELPSWQSYYGLTPSDWPDLRKGVRDALADGPLTLEGLAAAITARSRFRHLATFFDRNPWTLMKALAWQGDLSFGPGQGRRTTFQRLDANPRWTGLPELDDAGTRAVEAYFRSYGPATPDHLQYWLGAGLGVARKRIRAWIAGFGDRLAAIDIDGEPAYVLREDLEELTATSPSTVVRLLPGYDQWVLGPGTADAHVVPPGRRALVSRQADLVIVGGVVSGTWSRRHDELSVTLFAEGARPPGDALAAEVTRLATILDLPLRSSVATA